MAKFRRKPVVIDAVQWFKNGDHPEDSCVVRADPMTGQRVKGEGKVVRYFRHPDVSGAAHCPRCGHLNHHHGWIDRSDALHPYGHKVCPGDWIVTGAFGEHYPVPDLEMQRDYERVEQVLD